MNYIFPKIQNIKDILPAIEGNDDIYSVTKDGYIVFNYMLGTSQTFPAVVDEYATIRRECRGIIFDAETGDILRRPFHKFFNLNEREDTSIENVDFLFSHAVLDKLDGSMIAPFLVGDRMIWGTKMGETDVAQPVMEFVAANPQYDEFRYLIGSGFTPIFEWCSNKQRIVLDHPEDSLTLLAIRDIQSGEYVSFELVKSVAKLYDVPVVKQYETIEDINQFLEQTRGQSNIEGYVIRFSTGHMIKVKTDWYVALHKIKEQLLFDRNLVELILDNRLDDILSYLSSDERDNLIRFQTELYQIISDQSHVLMNITNDNLDMDRKTFALNIAPTLDDMMRPVAFKTFGNQIESVHDAEVFVIQAIRNGLTSNTKYDTILKNNWLKELER